MLIKPNPAGGRADCLASNLYSSTNWHELKIECARHWPFILMSLGVPEALLTGCHCACPFHGGKDGFRFDDKQGRGTWICATCGAGDGLGFVRRWLNCGFRDAVAAIGRILSGGTLPPARRMQIVQPSNTAGRTPEQNQQRLQSTWNEAEPIMDGDPVYQYLTIIRKLNLPGFPPSLRCHPGLKYWDRDGSGKYIQRGIYPAMIARFVNRVGEAVGLHATYLNPDGHKADVPAVKKLIHLISPGATKGGAIRIYEPSETLAVSEGIETALAVHLMTGLPVWSTWTAGNMEKLILPPGVADVRIYADFDESKAGQKAAFRLACRLEQERRKVRWFEPLQLGSDFADILAGAKQ